MPVFGFGHTNLGLVVKKCRGILGASGVQVITNNDALVRRRCYVVLGVDTLDAARIKLLNRSSAAIVIVDALPALKRVGNITILDSATDATVWYPVRPRFARLEQSLRAKPKQLVLDVRKDDTIDTMITSIRERSVLDSVLSAAKSMEVSQRALLHADVALMLVGKISLATFRRRCEGRGASGQLYELMISRLSDATAKRLSIALRQVQGGTDVAVAAKKNLVETSEIRFLSAKLKVK